MLQDHYVEKYTYNNKHIRYLSIRSPNWLV